MNSNFVFSNQKKKKNQFLVAVNDFFFSTQLSIGNTDFIVFFRILIGSLVLVHFLSILSDFDKLFASQAIIPADVSSLLVPKHIITFPRIISFLESKGISEYFTTLLFQISYITCSIFIVVGFLTRFSAILLLFLQVSLVKGSSLFAYGVDFFTSMSLFYIILFPSGRFYSVDNLIFKRDQKFIDVKPFLRLLQLHIAIAYFFSGFDKIIGYNWWNGEAIWKAINLPHSNQDFQINFDFLSQMPIIPLLMGWAIIIIELFYPLFMNITKTRKIWLTLTILMHIGIAIIFNLYFFSCIMIIWNLSAFYFRIVTGNTQQKSL